MKAVFLDDANDTTSANRETGLAELLRDDVDRGVRIEEALADNLANDLAGPDIVAFGAGFLALESCASVLTVEFEQLIISLFAQFELLSRLGGAEPFALAFDEHDQAGDDKVIRQDRKFSGGSNDAAGGEVELHGLVLQWASGKQSSRVAAWHPGDDSMAGRDRLIDCGVFLQPIWKTNRIFNIDNAINN